MESAFITQYGVEHLWQRKEDFVVIAQLLCSADSATDQANSNTGTLNYEIAINPASAGLPHPPRRGTTIEAKLRDYETYPAGEV